MQIYQYYPIQRAISFNEAKVKTPPPQLLKWAGNKQKHAHLITPLLPGKFNRYFEPFLGTGAVLAAMHPLFPQYGIASDTLKPLIEIMRMLQSRKDIQQLIGSYKTNLELYFNNQSNYYYKIRDRYNIIPNAFDLLFLSRTCVRGYVRFNKKGEMNTPMGSHKPMSAEKFAKRAHQWAERLKYVNFAYASFKEIMALAQEDDIVYCDAPYLDSQLNLYGAYGFMFQELIEAIEGCISRGAKVALSVDGVKISNNEWRIVDVDFPRELFKRRFILGEDFSRARKLLKTKQPTNRQLTYDRLLLTW